MVVYKITNKINSEIYIGQTTNLKKRIQKHFYYKNNSNIAKAIQEYGKENFIVEILFESDNQNEIDEKEKFFIELYNSIDCGYNTQLGGKNLKNITLEDLRNKISEKISGNLNHMSKRVIELKTNKIYDTATEASIDLNLNLSHICSVCRGDRNSTGGYIFRYLDENGNIIETNRSSKNKARRIMNIDTGEIFNSFKEISIKYNKKIDSGNIIKNINGKTKSSYGFHWKYID